MIKEILEMKNTYTGVKVNASSFNKDKTAIIIVDMINGFVNVGNLASPRVKAISPNIVNLLNKFNHSRMVFFRDIHSENSKELEAYPNHCVDGYETEIIKELSPYAYEDKRKELSYIAKKNSTNGFLSIDFQKWFLSNKDIKSYIVVGCVTDICLSDFAKTLQCYIYENNLDKEVVVPVNCTETYDYAPHNGDIMNIVSLYSMKLAGIKVIDEII